MSRKWPADGNRLERNAKGLPTFRQRRHSAKIGGLSRQRAAKLKEVSVDKNIQFSAVRVGMAHQHVVIIGSLAAGSHFYGHDGARAVCTKGVDRQISPCRTWSVYLK